MAPSRPLGGGDGASCARTATRFTAGRALFAGDDARDGGETDGASSAQARRQPAEIVRIDVMGRVQYYPGALGALQWSAGCLRLRLPLARRR